LPNEHRHRWVNLRATVVPLEVEILQQGIDWLFPGTREMLVGLRTAGVRIALASNCRMRYFRAVCEGQRLTELVDWAFCLDSPGVNDKNDMVAQAIAAAGGTRRAVVIGDREVDAAAAAHHGLPFVQRRSGYQPSEFPHPGLSLQDWPELWTILLAIGQQWARAGRNEPLDR
jgi:phosphoglycolate phosphatase-like HAD superfamily hydrolase